VTRSPETRYEDRVPNDVPNPADLTRPYPAKPDEASLNAVESERQRANHNPLVGGSSPSSGMTKAPLMPGFVGVA
jgi:hypothetical protein